MNEGRLSLSSPSLLYSLEGTNLDRLLETGIKTGHGNAFSSEMNILNNIDAKNFNYFWS